MTEPRKRSSLVLFAALAVFGGGAGLILALAPIPSDAAVGPAQAARAECAVRLAGVQREFGISLTNLSSVAEAGPTRRCAAYRTHLATIDMARDVYGTCMTGFARADQIGQLELAVSDWRSAIRERCGG